MSQRVKLAKTMVVDGKKVKVHRCQDGRIRADSYQGRIVANVASVLGAGCEFDVELPEFFRRPMTCQVLVAPGKATVIPRPTVTEGFGLFCKSITLTPDQDSEGWAAMAHIKLANDGELYIHAHDEIAIRALERLLTTAYRHAVDWFDADPLSPDPSPDDHLEVPSDGFEPMRVDLMKPFPMEIPQVVAEEPDPTSDVQ